MVEESDNSAQQLVSLLVEHFPSYRDVSSYKGRKGGGRGGEGGVKDRAIYCVVESLLFEKSV